MSPRTLGFAGLVLVGGVAALVLALRGGDRAPTPGPAVPPAAGDRMPAPPVAGGAPAPRARPLPPARRVPPPPDLTRPLGPPDKALALDSPDPGDQPLWSAFDEEARDEAWAGAQEEAIRARVGETLLGAANRDHPNAVQVPRIECRRVNCRLLVQSSDEPAFRHFVESLQDERGFYGDADQLALDAFSQPADKATGDEVYQVRVHLLFSR